MNQMRTEKLISNHVLNLKLSLFNKESKHENKPTKYSIHREGKNLRNKNIKKAKEVK